MKIQTSIIIILILLIITYLNVYIFFKKCSSADQQTPQYSSKWTSFERKIIFITPTYSRPVQEPELTRLAHTLLLVPNVHWILVEDGPNKTSLVSKLLSRVFQERIYHFTYTHLNAETPKSFKTSLRDPNWLKPRGVWQRNEALKWIRDNRNDQFESDAVVYFGDDDNTYDLELFQEIRTTKKVSVFPVGLVGGLLIETPLVEDGKVVGFNSIWKPKRQYPIDMAGFAVNAALLQSKKDAYFSPYVPRGYQETHLLTQLIQSIDELEPKADSCTKVLVWHTRTENPKLKTPKKTRHIS